MSITYKRVKELFNYKDGNLLWKVRKAKSTKIGDIAGCTNDRGYSVIQVDRKLYQTHRLIWLWHHGYLPEGGLDHTNRIRDDNRIENLREVSNQCNVRNTGNYKTNKSGVKGVYWYERRNRWCSFITVYDKNYHLGRFESFDEAVLHRLAAEQCLDWSNCDSSSPAYKYAVEHGLIRESMNSHWEE